MTVPKAAALRTEWGHSQPLAIIVWWDALAAHIPLDDFLVQY
jgi:hypothetical protein